MGVQNSEKVISFFSAFLSQSLASFHICKTKPCPLCVCVRVRAGRQTQGKVPLTNRDPDKEAARVRSRWRCGGSESQRFPLRLPPSSAHSRFTMNTLCRVTWLLVYFYSGGEKVSQRFPSTEEVASSVKGAHALWENGKVLDLGARITTESRIRLLRAGCARSVSFVWCYPQSQDAKLTQIFLGDADEALGHFVFPGYAATGKTFTFTTRQTTPEFTTKRSSRVLKFQHR